MQIIIINTYLHKHFNSLMPNNKWCNCTKILNANPTLTFKGWLQLIFLSNIYIKR